MSSAAPASSPAAAQGVLFMLGAVTVFSLQDGVSKLLAENHEPVFIVMIRYWAFAAFVTLMSARRPGGLRAAVHTRRPLIQIARGLLLAAQIVLITGSFALIGLAETHAVMAVYPLMIAALGAALLGERVEPAQWAAIALGFLGVLIVIRPGIGVFDPAALVPLLGAAMFATYGVLTRLVGRDDAPSVSFFYTGVAGAAGLTLVGPFFMSALSPPEWAWMALLCVLGATGHYFLIRAYEVAEAASLQPYAYLQLVFTSIMGATLFGEIIDAGLVIGSCVVVGAGLFALWRARAAARLSSRSASRRGGARRPEARDAPADARAERSFGAGKDGS